MGTYFWLLFLFGVKEAHAYIDPGTGSYLLQLAIGGLLGVAFTVRLYWRNLKSFFADLLMRLKK